MFGRFEHPLPTGGERRWFGPLFHPLLLVPARGRLVLPKVLVIRLLLEQSLRT
jgi:hypothetical protein